MRITEPSGGRRPRIQFYLSPELDKMVRENRAMAKNLGLRVDYQDAFRLWFLRENQEARKQLETIKEARKDHGDAQAA